MHKGLTLECPPPCVMPASLRFVAVPLTLAILAALSSCAGTPVIVAPPAPCSSLVPQAWRDGVAGAPLPQGNVIGDWVAFGDAQTGQLDKANGRTTDSLDIISRCEERDRAAVKAARPKFLGVF